MWPGDNLLDAVSCWSPASCVAVGYYATGKAHLGLVETLGPNGWTVTSIPQPSTFGDYPSGVSCTASGACVLVGNYASGPEGTVPQTLVESLGTSSWALVTSPSPDASGDYLAAVSCVAEASCQAVGHYSDGVAQGSLAEWPGACRRGADGHEAVVGAQPLEGRPTALRIPQPSRRRRRGARSHLPITAP